MLPLSEKRLRANAARSTGPVSAEGKARVARNAMRHGLLAKQILIGNESQENFKTLCDIIVQRFEPIDGFEYNLIEELAASYWRLRRAWALETEMFTNAMEKQTARRQLTRMDAAFAELAAQPKLPLLHRYESRLHLMYQRALKKLLLLRAAPHRSDLPNKPITGNPCNEFSETTAVKPAQTPPKRPKTAPKRRVLRSPKPSIHSPLRRRLARSPRSNKGIHFR